MTLRISPSLVDSFRYYRDTEFDSAEAQEAKLDELRAQIRGEKREPSEVMLRGRAWHEAVQTGLSEVVLEDGGASYRFDPRAVQAVWDNRPADSFAEVSGTLELPEIGVVMHLRTDGLVGNEIHEDKTTSRIDADRYVNTCQWRAYLEAFECALVVYHVVRLGKPRNSDVWEVKDYLPFRQYRYPAMRADLIQQVGDCKAFIIDQGLASYREEI